jgi:hypothetical protein
MGILVADERSSWANMTEELPPQLLALIKKLDQELPGRSFNRRSAGTAVVSLAPLILKVQ